MPNFFLARILSVIVIVFILLLVGCEQQQEIPLLFQDTKSGLYGYKDSRGNVVIEAILKKAGEFSSQGVAPALLADNEWWLINRFGSAMVMMMVYDNGSDYFSEGLARYRHEEKMGFINKMGEKAIPANFDYLTPFQNGLALFCDGCARISGNKYYSYQGGLWGAIDLGGEVVIPAQFSQMEPFVNGFAMVELNGKKVKIDRTGKFIE